MYKLTVSIKNLSTETSNEFLNASDEFVVELQNLPDIEVSTGERKVEGTRGVITVLTGIVLTGINLGIFAGIYTLAKDLYGLYKNAEVELTFEDGSSITLKNLTQKQAEQKIKEHLERNKKA